MNILRLLMLIAAGWLVWRIVRQVRSQWRPPIGGAQNPGQQDYQVMARCHQCGTHLPAQALSSDGLCGRCRE
ncbi:hypothetical protein [Sinimarinibacterium sp. NLF-5-8]|uniref:hypothetical protein n=1 Tax=Sinimarinibacterium sp. NLF-5-8 TaxID=2698684 RepID=UPI00137C097B|nr:hypothetical protein [Sinimarinibacterium sp. NLF-5-8]QHS09963.1 hypothetical protein GT972_07285 [Sinimarinibacterium sp. NLF-5-8]